MSIVKFNKLPSTRKLRSEAWKGSKNPSWKGGLTSFHCEFCGKLVKVKISKFKRSKHHFCGRKCYSSWRYGRVVKDIKSICENCGKEFYHVCYSKPRFCSKKCYLNYITKRQLVVCENCGKSFWKKANLIKKSNRDFCSKKCYGEATQGENNPNWRGGIAFYPYSPAFNATLKRQIRERDNYICQECGQTQEELGYKLHVHHIDYDKKNSNPNNLISLCRSCHQQTNFNRDDWTEYYQNKLIK